MFFQNKRMRHIRYAVCGHSEDGEEEKKQKTVREAGRRYFRTAAVDVEDVDYTSKTTTSHGGGGGGKENERRRNRVEKSRRKSSSIPAGRTKDNRRFRAKKKWRSAAIKGSSFKKKKSQTQRPIKKSRGKQPHQSNGAGSFFFNGRPETRRIMSLVCFVVLLSVAFVSFRNNYSNNNSNNDNNNNNNNNNNNKTGFLFFRSQRLAVDS